MFGGTGLVIGITCHVSKVDESSTAGVHDGDILPERTPSHSMRLNDISIGSSGLIRSTEIVDFAFGDGEVSI